MNDRRTTLGRFVCTDPADVGCEQALAVLHAYVDMVLDGDVVDAARRYPGVAAHLLACGSCEENFAGLLVAAGGALS